MFLDKKNTREEMRPNRMGWNEEAGTMRAKYYAKDIMGWNEEARPEGQRIKLFANARARTVEIAREKNIPTVL